MKEPILVDKVLPEVENIDILTRLSRCTFYIQSESKDVSFYDTAFNDAVPHVGYCMCTFDIGDPIYNHINPNDPLYIYSKIITNIVIDKANLERPKRMWRVHWNYYTQGQQGVGHKDKNQDNFLSILYNPHTTDGGTEILGKVYPDISGQAKVFKSNWEHRGIATKKNKARSSLNIILEY